MTTGPPMIKDENGVLVGYVFADIDQTQRDLGGWVADAKGLVASQLTLPAGYRLQWTGQYQFLAEMEARLRYVIPLTLMLVVALLYLSMRGWPQTFLVLSSLPFAVAGSVWLLAFMDYNLSTAVWVGLIAVAGVAAETGIVMVVYLDEAFARYMREGRIQKPEDVDAAVVEGAAARVRPLIMTVATTVLGLLPLLWESGVGADVSARTAAPVVGGLWSCMLLTLLVLPAAYAMWRRHQVRVGMAPSPLASADRVGGVAAHPCDVSRCRVNRLKLAELTSGVGALVLGVGSWSPVSALVRSQSRPGHVHRSIASCVRDVGQASVGGSRQSGESAVGRGVVLGVLATPGRRPGDAASSGIAHRMRVRRQVAPAVRRRRFRRSTLAGVIEVDTLRYTSEDPLKGEPTWKRTSFAGCRWTRRRRPGAASTTGRPITSARRAVRQNSTRIQLNS